jgi:hypothetical protein
MSHKDVPSIRRWLSFAILVATLFVYSLLAPFGYALLAVVSLFPTRDFKRRALFLQAIVRGAFRVCHAYLRRVGILDYRPTDVVPPDVDGCVVIANHPTLTDLYEKFFLRPLLRGSGHFSAGFGHPLSGKSVVESSVERLAQGFRVLLFPEGTRSPVGGGLRRFGRSAFEVACRADVPVVALVIHESPPWLAKGSRIAAPKEVMSVKSVQLLKVVHPRDFFGDSRLMRDYVESAYRQALALPEESGRDSKTSEGAPAPMMKAIGE